MMPTMPTIDPYPPGEFAGWHGDLLPAVQHSVWFVQHYVMQSDVAGYVALMVAVCLAVFLWRKFAPT